ncbi:MAG: ABC transporter permease [Pusillimonas sp.]|nr:ABC transporter permease [Pusillimonas sp.]MBC43918.1 ABC transporter permease [Pusillimonas sp.]HCP79634.1 MCE family protein [Pusillimonas sp.]|tara:strand:- start:20497 stop:21411 length:915 start_codon:yes stop_codon:yes gene_type:complete
MEPRAHHVLIGIFTVVVIALAVLATLWFGKYDRRAQTAMYTVVFNDPVRGLSTGSSVQFNGIRVGEITDLYLDPKDLDKVKATISIRADIPVRQSTQAQLSVVGITGMAVIALTSGQDSGPVLVAPPGEPYPVIVARPSPFSQIFRNGDAVLSGLTDLIQNANTLLSTQNVQTFSNTLAHLETASARLADQDIGMLISQLTDAAKSAAETLKSVDTLVSTEGRQVLQDTSRVMSTLERTASRLDKLIETNQQPLNDGMEGFAQIGPALQELKNTLASLRLTLRRLDDNPAAYLLGREPLQEINP